jgi:hypothetical protein
MTGEVVNLRRKRKEQARTARAAEAARNRARFRRTGAEKARAKMESERIEDRLDGHRLADAPDAPEN